MKSIKTSFLFFYSISCCFTLINSASLYAQVYTDSLEYYSNLALQPQNPNDLFNAFSYFDANYKKAIQQKDNNAAVNLLYYKASIEYKKGAYDDSEESAVDAISILDNSATSPYTISSRKSLYNLLGLVYLEKMSTNKALELYEKTFEIAENTKDSMIIHNNIALVYKDLGAFEKAKDELLLAYKMMPRNKDSLIAALIWDNLGSIYSELEDSKSLPLMMKALELICKRNIQNSY
jgi:tetratricopeptide (TPR) repeat protein